MPLLRDPPSPSEAPRVSVIMPMRNAARFVERAVRSVLDQDTRDLELLVVDDGSTDRSRELVRRVGDPRVRVLRGPRKGVAAAYNAGLAGARGSIAMRCDADDYLGEGAITTLLGLLDAHPEHGAASAGFAMVEPSGRLVRELACHLPAADVTDELLAGVTRTHFNTFATRIEHLRAVGGCREEFVMGEDIDLQLRLAEVCRVWFEPVLLYYYRLHDASITHTHTDERLRYFEELARVASRERALGGRDAIERGAAPPPPIASGPPRTSAIHVQNMLIGAAWALHGEGARLRSLGLGLRALSKVPSNVAVWRSVAMLALKSLVAFPGAAR